MFSVTSSFLFLFKFEANGTVFLLHQIRLEMAAGARRFKAGQQIGAARAEQFLHLFERNILLQDDSARAEIARFRMCDGTFADIADAMFKSRLRHFGHGPSDVWPEKSGASLASSSFS